MGFSFHDKKSFEEVISSLQFGDVHPNPVLGTERVSEDGGLRDPNDLGPILGTGSISEDGGLGDPTNLDPILERANISQERDDIGGIDEIEVVKL